MAALTANPLPDRTPKPWLQILVLFLILKGGSSSSRFTYFEVKTQKGKEVKLIS